MSVLWAVGPLTVRDVCGHFKKKRAPAYTTVMTTLDRLFKKRLLTRRKDGLAFIYEPALTRDDYRRRILAQTISGLITERADVGPVFAAFVDAAAGIDAANLARLDALIAKHRKDGK
ncbi:MAG: BlaI/MecI/CopY family transcriptional regulator [Deltaproteobacteria bacterium]|nr:BlaI/MecI/CopY family transcriptional regulator [Deltaproteobacteria bacterium]